MAMNSPFAPRQHKNRFIASAIEYVMLAGLAAAAMTAGFNFLLGLPR